MPKKVVIVGAGASGVFTAYLLEKQAPGEFDITILEKNDRVGGHARSVIETVGGETVSIDYGAQFFSESAQKEYCDMLREEEIFDVPGLIKEIDMGISIWHDTSKELLFRIPNSIWGILAAALGSVVQWLCFARMTREAKKLYDSGDWSQTFGDWLGDLDFWFASAAETEAFKTNVARPLMYQFGLVNPEDLDALSARFVVFYFLGSLPSGFDLTPFTVYNSMEGLDGIMQRLLDKYGLSDSVHLGKAVTSLTPDGDGWVVATADGSTFDADEVVLSSNPMQILSILPEESPYLDVRAVLSDLEFVDVKVRIQHPAPGHMPDDPADWSGSNVTVVDTDTLDDEPTHYMLTVWFGPVRDETAGAQFFKSWGSPSLFPEDSPSYFDHWHRLMVGTPLFMEKRQELRDVHQGVHALWYVGGYTIDYDSQNASLRAAHLAVKQILDKYGLAPLSPTFVMRRPEIEAAAMGESMLSEPQLPESFALIDAIEQTVSLLLPNHPAVVQWKLQPASH